MVSSTKSSCSIQRYLILNLIFVQLGSTLATVPCQVSTEKKVLSVHEAEREDSACSENCMYYLSLITSDSYSHSCYLKNTFYVEMYSLGNVIQLQVLPCL